jgi:hypothetical protein
VTRPMLKASRLPKAIGALHKRHPVDGVRRAAGGVMDAWKGALQQAGGGGGGGGASSAGGGVGSGGGGGSGGGAAAAGATSSRYVLTGFGRTFRRTKRLPASVSRTNTNTPPHTHTPLRNHHLTKQNRAPTASTKVRRTRKKRKNKELFVLVLVRPFLLPAACTMYMRCASAPRSLRLSLSLSLSLPVSRLHLYKKKNKCAWLRPPSANRKQSDGDDERIKSRRREDETRRVGVRKDLDNGIVCGREASPPRANPSVTSTPSPPPPPNSKSQRGGGGGGSARGESRATDREGTARPRPLSPLSGPAASLGSHPSSSAHKRRQIRAERKRGPKGSPTSPKATRETRREAAADRARGPWRHRASRAAFRPPHEAKR